MSQIPHLSVAAAPCVLSLSWTLCDAQGEVLDILEEPRDFLVGGVDLPPAMEQALLGQAVDAVVLLRLEPEQAFGEYDEHLVQWADRAAFPSSLAVGAAIELPAALRPDEGLKTQVFIVTDIYPEHIVLDANHPLAGMGLQIEMRVHALRAPSPEELSAKSAGTGFFRMSDLVGA